VNTQRLLLVCDGLLQFDNSLFGLNDLSSELSEISEFGANVCVTCRGPTDALLFNDLVGNNDLNYEQVWIFAQRGAEPAAPLLAAPDVAALTEFMNLGGGVFITGDHGGLGRCIGSSVTRIRQMRRWDAINSPAEGNGRIVTSMPYTETPELDEIDAIIKPIFPEFVRPNASIHKLTFHRANRVLRWLPDHRHEGNLEFCDRSDFGEHALAVSTVAWAMAWNQMPGVNGAMHSPRKVPVINCFDPDLAPGTTWGPIVVDSTFHHFLNGNIEPLRCNPNREYFDHWRSYLVNLINFLTPRRKAPAIASNIKSLLRKQVAVNEFIPEPPKVRTVEQLGAIQNTIQKILNRQPLSHRLLLLNAKTQCSKTLCEDLAEELCRMPP
jgi:hypothetical protein